MAWTFITKHSSESIQSFISSYEYDIKNSSKLLDCYVVDEIHNMKTAYCAFQLDHQVIGMVILIDENYQNDSEFNFGFKAIYEECGPTYYECPNHILDLLSETDNETANKWRERCRSNNLYKN